MVPSAPKKDSTAGLPNKDALLERQKEYRMAALKAKQAGDIDQAKMHIKTSKVRCGFNHMYIAMYYCFCTVNFQTVAYLSKKKKKSAFLSGFMPSKYQNECFIS